MEKKKYEELELEVVRLDAEDVITTSGEDEEICGLLGYEIGGYGDCTGVECNRYYTITYCYVTASQQRPSCLTLRRVRAAPSPTKTHNVISWP